MDIRNVQKTGNMFYVYLPTVWCKAHNISSSSKVSLDYGDRDSLVIIPNISETKAKKLHLTVKEDDPEILQKLVTSAYISQADSFRIELDKRASALDLLEQKKFFTFEPIELDGNTISCESSVAIGSPISLLSTMVVKISNLLTILKKNPDEQLVNKYEDEIDKVKVFIEKSVISSLTYQGELKFKATDLYYASNISKSLEHMTDYLRFIGKKDAPFLERVTAIMGSLKELLKDADRLTYMKVVGFTKKVLHLPKMKVKDPSTYDKIRVRRNLIHVTEALMDWAIHKEVEKTK